MWRYVLICCFAFLPSALVARKGRQLRIRTGNATLLLVCPILAFFMACRALSVGVDTQFYAAAFQHIAELSGQELLSTPIQMDATGHRTFDFEPGYRVFNKLVSELSPSSQAITAANALLILFLLAKLVKKASPEPLLSLWLYVTLGVFQTEMNVTRNAIAILICYLALEKLKRGQTLRYDGGVLFAMLFHRTAILMLILPFLVKRCRLREWSATMLIGLSIMAGRLLPRYADAVGGLLPEAYAAYLKEGNQRSESVLLGVFCAVVFLLAYLCLGRRVRKRLWREEPVGMWMFTLNMCCFGIGTGFTAGARVAAYFVPYMIILIPQILERMQSRKLKIRNAKWIALLCGVQYLGRLLINNIGGTLPYLFFWG